MKSKKWSNLIISFVKVKFKYKFQIVGDGKYGNINEATGEWNGMIKELQDQVRGSPWMTSRNIEQCFTPYLYCQSLL